MTELSAPNPRPDKVEPAKDSKGRGISLTKLSDVREEAGSLYNFCRKQWRVEDEKIGPVQAKALAALLNLVKASIVEDEIERRLAALEQAKRESANGKGVQAGTDFNPYANRPAN